MEELDKILRQEIPQFRELGHKFFKKELSVGEFKGISGGMGAYAQRGGEAFMVRLRIPSGIMNIKVFKDVYEIAKSKNLEIVHLTTRQAIQLHDLSIDEVCDIMEEALDRGIYTRGGGGNFPRNVSISPLTGVDKEESFDVTEYAMAVNKYFMERIVGYKLPRKLKVSFSSSNKDMGNASINDLGFLAVNKDGKPYFKIYIGGGLGKNPVKSLEYDELIDPKDVLYYVEGMVNLFIAEGNYENKNKARVRYMVEKLGAEEFIKAFKNHVNKVKEEKCGELDVNIQPKEYNKKGIVTDFTHERLIPQKQEGLYTVYFHPINGQLKLDAMKMLIDKLENIEDPEFRLSMSEGMYIRNLNGDEAKSLIEATQNLGGETKLERSMACIGVPTCQMGIAQTQSTLIRILDYFKEKNFTKDVLPCLHISGCLNSCGTHEVGKIGFTGKKKRIGDAVEEAYELHINGCVKIGETKLGDVYGDIASKKLPEFLYELAVAVDSSNLTYEEFIHSKKEDFDNIVKKYLV